MLVETNDEVFGQYETYIHQNEAFHSKNKMKSWIYLIKLNLRYRVFKNSKNSITPPVLTQEQIQSPNSSRKIEKGTEKSTHFTIPLVESEVLPTIISTVDFVSQIKEYDIVSFDIFDTLLLRKTERPTDIFAVLGIQLGIPNFRRIRMEAEKEARLKTLKSNGEINIYDIYDVIQNQYTIDIEDAVAKEIALEHKVCIANPYMQEIFNKLKEDNKTIIAVSDMYLTKSMIEELLDRCGYQGIAEVFVSSEYRCNKKDGQLQQIAHNKMGWYNSMVHIGDNFANDFKATKEKGIEAIHYTRTGFRGKDFRPQGMSLFTGSFYKGLVNNYLHCGTNSTNMYFEHGFIHAGLLVCGYCEWLNKLSKQENIDKFIFLGRDCESIYEVYTKNYNQVDGKYIKISRFAAQQLVLEDFTEEIIENLLLSRANFTKNPMTVGQALQETDLELIVDYLEERNLRVDDILDKQAYMKLRDLIYNHKQEIVAEYKETREAAERYIKSQIQDAKKVCIIDIGWKGTAIVYLKHLIEKKYGMDVKVVGSLMGTLNNEYVNALIDAKIIYPYAFAYNHNQHLCMNPKTHPLKNKATLMTEAVFTSAEPTLLKYKLDANKEVAYEYGNVSCCAKNIAEIHRGIFVFAELYNEYTKDFKDMCEITSSDAYIPFRQALYDPYYCNELFKYNVEAVNTFGGFIDAEKFTTLGAMLEELNIIKK